jgi:hypothetical protein
MFSQFQGSHDRHACVIDVRNLKTSMVEQLLVHTKFYENWSIPSNDMLGEVHADT